MDLSRCAHPGAKRGCMGRGLVVGMVHRMLRHLSVEASADKEEASNKPKRDDFHALSCHKGGEILSSPTPILRLLSASCQGTLCPSRTHSTRSRLVKRQ